MKKLIIVIIALVAFAGCKKETTPNFNPMKANEVFFSTFNPNVKLTFGSVVWTSSTLRATVKTKVNNIKELTHKYGTVTGMNTLTPPVFSQCQNREKAQNQYAGSWVSGNFNPTTMDFNLVYKFKTLADFNKAQAASCRAIWGSTVTVVGSTQTGATKVHFIEF